MKDAVPSLSSRDPEVFVFVSAAALISIYVKELLPEVENNV